MSRSVILVVFTCAILGHSSELLDYELRELLAVSLEAKHPMGISFEKYNPPSDTTVNIGLVIPLSVEPELSAELIMGAELAVTQINKKGGINGKRLVVVRGDSNANTEVSQQVTQELIDRFNTQVIIGPIYSNFVEGVAKNVTIPSRIPMILPTATASKISFINHEMVFRLAPNNRHISDKVQIIMNEYRLNKIAIFYQMDKFGEDLRQLMSYSNDKTLKKVVFEKGLRSGVNYKKYDLSPDIAEIKAKAVNGFYLPLTDESVQWSILNQLIAGLDDPLPVVVLPEQQTYREEHSEPMTSRKMCVYSVVIDTDEVRNSAINKTISDFLKTQSKHYYAALMHDAIYLTAAALNHQKIHKSTFNKSIRSLTQSSPVSIDIERFDEMLTSIKQSKSFLFHGIVGPIILNEYGDNIGIKLGVKSFHKDFGSGCFLEG